MKAGWIVLALVVVGALAWTYRSFLNPAWGAAPAPEKKEKKEHKTIAQQAGEAAATTAQAAAEIIEFANAAAAKK